MAALSPPRGRVEWRAVGSGRFKENPADKAAAAGDAAAAAAAAAAEEEDGVPPRELLAPTPLSIHPPV
jgi:hypothetical protein